MPGEGGGLGVLQRGHMTSCERLCAQGQSVHILSRYLAALRPLCSTLMYRIDLISPLGGVASNFKVGGFFFFLFFVGEGVL